MLHRSLLTLVLLAVAAVPALATPFTATYTFTGALGNQASHPVDANPLNAVLSDITRGPGIAAMAGLNSINSDGWTTGATPDLVNDYYEWTITPAAGYEMDVTFLGFTSRRSGTGPRTVEVRSSVDGFAVQLLGVGLADTTDNLQVNTGLGGIVNVTGPVTFRIYGYAAESALGTYRLGISAGDANASLANNLELQGDLSPITTAVPEPASLLLLASGVAVLIGSRRKLRKS